MHKYFFPTADTFITNDSGYGNKNFGATEIVKVGTVAGYSSIISPTTSQSYNDDNVTTSILEFSGSISGSFMGEADRFVGNISSSNSSIDTTYFSGSINNIPTVFSGSIITSSLSGTISGSLIIYDCNTSLSGSATNLNGNVSGILTGNGLINYPSTTIVNNSTAWRTILQFDLTDISQSIVNNGMGSASFYLNLKVCDERELPISYSIYAFAISQSWTKGTGYLSDGGSLDGVSWLLRDGTSNWVNTTASIHSNIKLTISASADGGGTWYPSSVCSQSFNYTTSDIKMDVTPIVSAWLSGSIPNEGIILIASAEVSDPAYTITYFSEDTNTIYSPFLDMGWNSLVFITGSNTTSSVSITNNTASISGITTTSSYFITAPAISGTFSGSAGLNTTTQLDPTILSASGIVFGTGLDGNIINLPFLGAISGIISSASYEITGSCGNTFNAQLITASFQDGVWNGLTFTAYYVDNKVENAVISGSFPDIWISNCNFSITNLPYNMSTSSYYSANLNSDYISGDLIGKLTFNTTGSASYDGFFTDGIFNGYEVVLPFIGNIYTSSFSYTSSINYTSSLMSGLDISQPFNVNVKDLNYSYQRGNVIKIYVNSAEKYPVKNFNVGYQFDQFNNTYYLPSSSYYGIKDNITNEMVIDFDEYTQLNCNYPVGNYFELDTDCLFPEREYQILLKISAGGDIYTIDTGKKFKIVK